MKPQIIGILVIMLTMSCGVAMASGSAGKSCILTMAEQGDSDAKKWIDVTPIKEEKAHRFFSGISEAQLREKLAQALKKISGEKDFSGDVEFQQGLVAMSKELNSKVAADLSKLEFESNEVEPGGFTVLENGMVYYGINDLSSSGTPTFYILYWDGNGLRGYVPTAGNLWNTKTKTPYGENGLLDVIDLKKRFPKAVDCEIESDEDAVDYVEEILPRLKLNKELMNQEIMARIAEK
jgi:hypothetical protein